MKHLSLCYIKTEWYCLPMKYLYVVTAVAVDLKLSNAPLPSIYFYCLSISVLVSPSFTCSITEQSSWSDIQCQNCRFH